MEHNISVGRWGAVAMVAAMLSGVAAGGCAESQKNRKRADARSLYHHSAVLIKSYTDSIASARDTVELFRIAENFEKAIDRLNFNYPPETDMSINEGENDTLSILTERYLRVRGERWKKLMNIVPDSVSAADTVPPR